MPVNVECTLKPSKLRLIYSAMPWLAGLAFWFLWSQSILAAVFWLSLIIVFVAHLRSEPSPKRVRFTGSQVQVWEGDHVQDWTWQGRGRSSHAFVQWNLHDRDAQCWRLRIWRDAVSDSSWRAMNMAYRVNRSEALTQAET